MAWLLYVLTIILNNCEYFMLFVGRRQDTGAFRVCCHLSRNSWTFHPISIHPPVVVSIHIDFNRCQEIDTAREL